MKLSPLMLALVLSQGGPLHVRHRVPPGNPDSQCLYWLGPDVTWSLALPADTTHAAAIGRSFRSWQDVFDTCGNLRLEQGPPVQERTVGWAPRAPNHNLVLLHHSRCAEVVQPEDACWSEDSCGNTYDCWDEDPRIAGLTTTTFDTRSGIVLDADIQLNAASFTFTTEDGAPCVPPQSTGCVSTDVQNVVTHEVGHLLGLDHSPDSRSTMYPDGPPGETSKRTLDEGSREFVCTTYPQGQPSQGCVLRALEPRPVLGRAVGCASAGAEAWLAALAGWGAFLRRRSVHRGGSPVSTLSGRRPAWLSRAAGGAGS